MIWLDSEKDRPDFDWFRNFLSERCKQGFRVRRPEDKVKQAEMFANEALDWIRVNCGIYNMNSPQQVNGFLANLGDPVVEQYCMVNGKMSSKSDNLVELAVLGYKWAMQMVKYKENYGTIKNVNMVMSCADLNGRVHPDVTFTKTNRVSYSSPAIMSIKKNVLWDTILPMVDGNFLWSVDIKNQEPWILVHMTRAQRLIDLAAKAGDSGCSLYKAIYADIFEHGLESEEAYAEMKMAWNMLTYGGSLKGLVPRCKIIDANAVYNYFNGVPELKQYSDRAFSLARKNVQSAQTVFGTTVFANKEGRGLRTSLMDIPIQGTGADILCLLVKRITEQLNDMFEGKPAIRIYFTRHDELIFDVDREWQLENGPETVKGLLRDVCSHRIDDWAPFGLDVEQLV